MTSEREQQDLGRALQALLELGCVSVEFVQVNELAVQAQAPCGCLLEWHSGGTLAEMVKRARVDVDDHLRTHGLDG